MGSKDELVETIYGRHHKFEIYREWGGFLSSTAFRIYRDGEYWRGTYDSLKAAVDALKAER